MSDLQRGIWMAIASSALVFFTYHFCMKSVAVEAVIRTWATKNGYRILSTFPIGRDLYFLRLEVTLIDQQQQKHHAIIRVDWWFIAKIRERDLQIQWRD